MTIKPSIELPKPSRKRIALSQQKLVIKTKTEDQWYNFSLSSGFKSHPVCNKSRSRRAIKRVKNGTFIYADRKLQLMQISVANGD